MQQARQYTHYTPRSYIVAGFVGGLFLLAGGIAGGEYIRSAVQDTARTETERFYKEAPARMITLTRRKDVRSASAEYVQSLLQDPEIQDEVSAIARGEVRSTGIFDLLERMSHIVTECEEWLDAVRPYRTQLTQASAHGDSSSRYKTAFALLTDHVRRGVEDMFSSQRKSPDERNKKE